MSDEELLEQMAQALQAAIDFIESVPSSCRIDQKLTDLAYDGAHVALSNYESKQKQKETI